jgi:simple sugar transport system permease protein
MLVLLGLGLSSFIGGTLVGKTTQGFQPIAIPVLSQIPILGPVLFQHNILVYLAMLLAFLAWVFLFKTRLGLEVIAVGESPEAADTVGIPVQAIRYACVLTGGMLAGVGGAFLSLAYTRMWVDQMTAGRGWIAVALVIFSAWLPHRALLGAYFFGGIEGLQLRLQAAGIGISYNILQMMPYVATILVLLFSARREFRQKMGAPEALLRPYIRGERI